VAPRGYDARLRRERGTASRLESRRRILDAARTLFLEQGYTATTIKAIAVAAGVGTATIYAAPLSKREILLAIRDIDLAGNDEPVPLLEQDWTRVVAGEPDPQRQMALWVHHQCEITGRADPILDVLREAIGADPQLEADYAEDQRRRYVTQTAMVTLLTHWQPHQGYHWPVADGLWALLSPLTYHQLRCERQWVVDDIENWFRHLLSTAVFEVRP
jgi:AcrR family transcriptional regulator